MSDTVFVDDRSYCSGQKAKPFRDFILLYLEQLNLFFYGKAPSLCVEQL